jgi:hypothetical protein
MKKEKLEKYILIHQERLSGKKITEISKLFDITHQRISQILNNWSIEKIKCKLEFIKNGKTDYNNKYNFKTRNGAYGLAGRDYIRELVRIRDNHTCQTCKRIWNKNERRFDVHHLGGLCGKKSRLCDSKKDMDGLITLCHKCHFNHPEHTLKTKKRKIDITT